MRRALIGLLCGALILALLTTWLGPKMIGWYVTPADQPAAMSCQAAVVGAMHRLVQTQLIGTVIGAVIGLLIGIFARRKRAAPTPPTSPTTTAPKTT